MGERRYTFSQVMNGLVEIESRLAGFYDGSARHAKREDVRNLFSSLANQSKKRELDLTRMRQKTIVEMAIEPITMKLDEYSERVMSVLSNEKLPDLQRAVECENLVRELCRHSAGKVVNVSADAGSLLEELSEESDRRVKKMQGIK